MEKLNKLDLKILRVVSQDARTTIKDIAAICNASRAAVNNRLQRLIDTGVISSSGYMISPESLGYKTCTFVGIRLDKGSIYQEVVDRIKEIDEVIECHATTGRFSLLLKVYAIDNRDLMRILTERIQIIAGVKDTETLISLENSFERSITLPPSILVEQ